MDDFFDSKHKQLINSHMIRKPETKKVRSIRSTFFVCKKLNYLGFSGSKE